MRYCQIKDGYFVHHFSPSGLHQIDKNIVLVLDRSVATRHDNSKLEEVKTALTHVLEELRPQDLFNVVAYSNKITYWNRRSVVSATPDNVHSAKLFVANLSTSTGLFLY